MATLKVKNYIGDESFISILTAHSKDISLDTLKACILGIQSSPGRTKITAVMDFLRGGGKQALSNQLITAVEGLWYHLYALTDYTETENFRFMEKSGGRQNYVDFVSVQVQAGDEFIKRLHLGGYKPGKQEDSINKLYSLFSTNMELLRALEAAMKDKWTDDDFADMGSFIQKLERFSIVMWKTMVSMKNVSKQEKLKRLKNKAIIGKIEEQLGAPIGRNESCPCGSGKKYKLCCGS